MRLFLLLGVLFGHVLPGLVAQTTLLEADFNDCNLPAGWQAKLNGNLSAQWYVGLSQNAAALNQSLDSTCMLFIDDNILGAASPGYVLDFISPPFDASAYETVELTLDVHYRHKGGTPQHLDVLISDGANEYLLTRFQDGHRNEADLQDFFKLRYDLRLLTQAPEVRLILRYDDSAAAFGWWAGIDNIRIAGNGSGTVVLGEAFNGCAKPPDWQTEVLSGQKNWSFGLLPSTSSAYSDGYSMDGSCFVFYDDNAAGDTAPPTSIRLLSPWFEANRFFHYQLDFDFIFRYFGDYLLIYAENETGEKFTLLEKEGQIGGPYFPSFQHFQYDLSAYRSEQLRIIFEYRDKGAHGYWLGMDNFKVTGTGPAMDFCDQAETLTTGAPCKPANNTTALFNGPQPDCSGRAEGALWYKWTADFTGIARVDTRADFNDVVNVYTGACANPQPLVCTNRDEHGFTGESTFFPVETDSIYFIRVSGLNEMFGTPRGNICVSVNPAPGYPQRPANDDCPNAQALSPGLACVPGNNRNANNSAYQPSYNELARADVWYKFTAGAPGPNAYLEFRSNANFSDIITLYSGGCASLKEIAGNHKGGHLRLPDSLQAGQTYYLQVAGTFASVEGDLCPELRFLAIPPQLNDNCAAALPVVLGADCASGSNTGAGFSGYQPACAVAVDHDIWFSFTAPASGSVQINTGADFEHTLAVWQGSCDSLKPVFCTRNPLRCAGYVTVGPLTPNQNYFVQIASLRGAGGMATGTVCLKILNGQSPPDITPIALEVLQPCVAMGTARLYVQVTGGRPPYTFLADTNRALVPSGQPFAVIIQDAAGCEAQFLDTALACASSICTADIQFQTTQPSCPGAADGKIQTLVTGASSALFFNWSNQVYTALNAQIPAGSYQLTLTDLNGCEYLRTVDLPDRAPIQIQTDSIAQPVEGLNNGAIRLSIQGGTPPLQFQWFRNDTLIPGDGADLDSLPGGQYTLFITDSLGCTDSISILLTETVTTRGAVELLDVRLYPNPASDRATLTVGLPYPQALHLSIADALGQERQTQWVAPASRHTISLDLRAWPPGLYLLRLQTGQTQLSRRLVVGR